MRSSGAAVLVWVRVLHVLLLAVVLGAKAAAETPSEQQQGWRLQLPLESQVSVGVDGIVRSTGAGCSRSDGLSITRSTPYDTDVQSDLPVDDQAIRFAPTHVDLGRVETCVLHNFYVNVENRGDVVVRLEAADFTRDGFSVDHDVRGIWMDPGDHFDLKISLLPSEPAPQGIETDLRLFTTSGIFVLPIRSTIVSINRYGVQGIRASVPVGVQFEELLTFSNPFKQSVRLTELYALDSFVDITLYNDSQWLGPRWPRPSDGNEPYDEPGVLDMDKDYERRVDRGAWDMAPGTTSPLATVRFTSDTPGQFLTHIQVAANEICLLLVPVRLTVLKPGIHLEPKLLDIGMLTSHEAPRELFFAVHNAGRNPMRLLELKVLESNLLVSVQLRGPTVIPPLSRVHEALAVQVRVDAGMLPDGDECYASLLLKTNGSSAELAQRRLRLYGRVVNGHVAFRLNETRVGVVVPMANVFSTGNAEQSSEGDGEEAEEVEGSDEAERVPSTQLMSLAQADGTPEMMIGTREIRKLRVWNEFDQPVELQHVWIPPPASLEDEQQQEVSVYAFKQGVAPPGAAWPDISLQITPTIHDTRGFLAPRSYPIMIETNVTVHRVYFHLFLGILDVKSSSGLQNHSHSGYYLHPRTASNTSTRACTAVPDDGLIPAMAPRIDGGGSGTDIQGVQVCRSLLFDLGKVASHRTRIEVVEVTNVNPVSMILKVADVAASDKLDMTVTADISLADEVSVAIATLGNLNKTINNNHGEARNEWSELEGGKSNSSSIVSAGDDFNLLPGHRITFHVALLAKNTLGTFTEPVVTLETPAEVMHLFVRFRGVHGTIEPVTPTIVLPPMFPGRTEFVHLHYRNTFAHSVTPLMATLDSPVFRLLSMSDVVGPRQVERVLDLLVSPSADSKCSEALFLADCLLPPRPPTSPAADQTCEHLSGFGEFVDECDLVALRRRDAFWSEAQHENQSRFEAQVHLRTDIMDDVGAVTIKTQMQRPLVTAVSAKPTTTAPGKNATASFERREFVLTEVLNRSELFVSVLNPSNITVQMELAITKDDHELFYSCDDDVDLGDWGDDIGDEETAGIAVGGPGMLLLCLEEWSAAVTEATTGDREHSFRENIPPFFFQTQIVHVPAGQETQLGPIYYLPSQVGEIATTVFVRNELSHIEPVPLLARSGKGTLELTVNIPPASDASKSTARYVARASSDSSGSTGRIGMSEPKYEGLLSFSLGKNDDVKDFTSVAQMQIANTGPFGLPINRVLLKDDPKSSSDAATGFLLVSELLELEHESSSKQNGPRAVAGVLPAGETARVQISFRASCFVSSVASWLVIDTSDGTKRIKLEGSITPEAAFECRRARVPALVCSMVHMAWMASVAIAVGSMVYVLQWLVRDTWAGSPRVENQLEHASIDASSHLDRETDCSSSAAENCGEGGKTTFSQTAAWVDNLLKDVEQASSGPSARGVTPAVARLLERRQRGGLGSITRNGVLRAKTVSSVGASRGQLGDDSKQPEAAGVTTSTGEQKRAADAGEERAGPALQLHPKSSAVADTRAERREERPLTARATRMEPKPVSRVGAAGRLAVGVTTSVTGLQAHHLPGKLSTAAYEVLLRSGESNDDGELNADSRNDIQDPVESEEDQPEDPEELQSSGPASNSIAASVGSEEFSQATGLRKSRRELLDVYPRVLSPSAPGILAQPAAATSLLQKAEEPFEAFESMSARWRAEDWNVSTDDQAPFPALTELRSDERWGGASSFMSAASDPGEVLAGKLREAKGGPGVIHRDSHSFIEGTGAGAFFDELAMFGPAPAPSLSASGAKKAPPGFTPADAAPLETRAAFQRLRGDPLCTTAERSSVGSSNSSLPFAGRLSLFGSTLSSRTTELSTTSGAGRIGSGRPRHSRSASDSKDQDVGERSGLAVLGGLELSSPLPSSPG